MIAIFMIWFLLTALLVLSIVAAAKQPMPTPGHFEMIICPQCDSNQDAWVEHTEPFYSYVHWCGECGYCIMESEWQLATDQTKTALV
jgi:hypothetical protein